MKRGKKSKMKKIDEQKFNKNRKYIKGLIVEEFSYKQLLFLNESFGYLKKLNSSTVLNIFKDALKEAENKNNLIKKDKKFNEMFKNLSEEQINLIYRYDKDSIDIKKFIKDSKKKWIKIHTREIEKNYSK